MTLEDLSKLPSVKIDKKRLSHYEIAEVSFTSDPHATPSGLKEYKYIMYIEGLEYSGRRTGFIPTLVGFLGIKKTAGFFGGIKTKKDPMFIPTQFITDYTILQKNTAQGGAQ